MLKCDPQNSDLQQFVGCGDEWICIRTAIATHLSSFICHQGSGAAGVYPSSDWVKRQEYQLDVCHSFKP